MGRNLGKKKKKGEVCKKAKKSDTDLKPLFKRLYPVFFAGQVSSCVAALSRQV